MSWSPGPNISNIGGARETQQEKPDFQKTCSPGSSGKIPGRFLRGDASTIEVPFVFRSIPFPWHHIGVFFLLNLNSIADSAHKQYSLLDTIFSYIFGFGPPGKYL